MEQQWLAGGRDGETVVLPQDNPVPELEGAGESAGHLQPLLLFGAAGGEPAVQLPVGGAGSVSGDQIGKGVGNYVFRADSWWSCTTRRWTRRRRSSTA